jgi:hypothetical protein
VTYQGSQTFTLTGPIAVADNTTLSFKEEPVDGPDDGTEATNDITISDATVVSISGRTVTVNLDAELADGDTRTLTVSSYFFHAAFNPEGALDPDSATRPIVGVDSTGSLNITYQDASPRVDTTVRVDSDSTAPVFTDAAPAHNGASTNLKQLLSVNVSDGLQSGVNDKNVKIRITTDSAVTDPNNAQTFVPIKGGSTGDLIVDAATGVVTAKVSIEDLKLSGDVQLNVQWWAEATDKSGNSGFSDADSTTAGNQPYVLLVDNIKPALTNNVFPGDNFDAVSKTIVGDRVGLSGKSKTDTIRMEFSEALDSTSVSADDFTVDGVTPSKAEVIAAPKGTATDVKATLSKSVFITLAAPMGPSATPTVALVGSITDKAGNVVNAGSKTATDGLAPQTTVALSATLSKAKVNATVSTDEDIRSVQPLLTFVDCCSGSPGVTPSVTRTAGSNEWKFAFNIATAGQYNMQVQVEDVSLNKATAGNADPTKTSALVFEIDNALPRPLDADGVLNTSPPPDNADTAANESETTIGDTVFVVIQWNNETGEYTGDSHKKVTLTKVELDGTDIKHLTTSKDSIKWTVAIPKAQLGATESAQLGKHKLVFNGEDEVGNTLAADETLNFTVVARPLFKVGIAPGINLISLRAAPADTAIDSVIGKGEDIDLVATYEPDDPLGPWLIAVRDSATGLFAGPQSSLTTMDAGHAYVVRAGSFLDLKVDVPVHTLLGAFPPTIPVSLGWNLVPVADITGLAAGSNIAASTYFSGLTWSRAFTFDPTINNWVKVVAGDNVEVGKGYWVWVTKGDTIVP